MGSKSRSSNSTTNNVTNYSLQGFENAQAAVAGNNNKVTVTDHGAIDSAMELGGQALDLSNNAIDANVKVTTDALDKGFGFGEQALDKSLSFGERAIESNEKVIESGFDFGKQALKENGEVIKGGFDFAETLVEQNTATSAANQLAIRELAEGLATGGASTASSNSLKAVYTIGGVAVVVILGIVFLGRVSK